MPSAPVIGRFAPSPTGPLHLGSLIAALGSLADARSQGGRWLLRIEDIDPPREQPGAADSILRSLERHALHWDGPVQYQHDHAERYEDALARLRRSGDIYACICSRAALARAGAPDCLGGCRATTHAARGMPPAGAWRLRHGGAVHYRDRLRGELSEDLGVTCGDFVLKRRDGLYAYQLAVVVDDAASGITDVVRGADLLDNTARQCWLMQRLGLPRPRYLHLPLIVGADGQKLSKQNHAPALRDDEAARNLWQALDFLRQSPPPELARSSPATIVDWAVDHWRPDAIPLADMPA